MPALTRIANDRQMAAQARLSAAIVREQASITDGKLSRPSDAPADWIEVGTLAREASDAAAWDDNLARLENRAKQGAEVLGALSGHAARARELLIQASGPSGRGSGAAPIADELAAIRADMTALLATRASDGEPLFSPGTPLSVPVGPGQFQAANSARDQIATVTGAGSLDAIMLAAETAVRGGMSIDPALADMKSAIDHLSLQEAGQGVALRRVETRRESMEGAALVRAERRSDLADTDIAAALTRIQQGLTTLEAARATMVRMTERTLFDLLR